MSLYFSADLLPEAYEPNVATQMTSGKAIARALRGLMNLYQPRGILKCKLSLRMSTKQWTPIIEKRY